MGETAEGLWTFFMATGLPQAYLLAKGEEINPSPSDLEGTDAPDGDRSRAAGGQL